MSATKFDVKPPENAQKAFIAWLHVFSEKLANFWR